MNLPLASQGADELQPPADSGTHVGTATSTTTTAANLALTCPRGGAWFTFQARGGDVYVRFKATATTAATTSGDTSNGLKIPADQSRDFWITDSTNVCDHICSAVTKALFWWQSSPNYGNRT